MTAPLKARYFTADGQAGSARTLPADPFDGVVHEESLHAAVKVHLANRRQGTAAAKSRGEVRGGGRKPWRQKGTGRARVGSIRSPIWRGGGIVFPPVPRSYRLGLPKKVRRLARRSAFNARAAEDRVIVLEDLTMERPRTRELVKLLDKLGVGDHKVLILTAGKRPNMSMSARNLPNVEVRHYGHESAYDVLWADSVVIEESALAAPVAAKATGTSEGASDA
ncbi:MAG: 50S ribosomal protein L4 [Gemmatimonadota bacterium]|nr:MAG: 50S ribosomal protein L4 [Gemmatimonadota bacterium]